MNNILPNFKSLLNIFDNDIDSLAITEKLESIFHQTFNYLSELKRIELTTSIPGKKYFSYIYNTKISRAINDNLYRFEICKSFFDNFKNNTLNNMSIDDLTKSCYTISSSFFAAIDIINTNDQKSPGTYFEKFIGQLLSVIFHVKPTKSISVPAINHNEIVKLPTDFIFDLGNNNPKFHVPVKTSTRERVIQVWAHQRIIDGVYGIDNCKGILFCAGETKLDHKTKEVTEICLPGQWSIYQRYIANLKRVYYLDVPNRYSDMEYVKQLGEFIYEFANI